MTTLSDQCPDKKHLLIIITDIKRLTTLHHGSRQQFSHRSKQRLTLLPAAVIWSEGEKVMGVGWGRRGKGS